MGHRADENLPELKSSLGIKGDAHDEELLALLRAAQEQIEHLAGRRFGAGGPKALRIAANGLPFVEISDLQTDARFRSDEAVWPVPDPVNGEVARILEMRPPDQLAASAGPLSAPLRTAAGLVATGVSEAAFTKAVWHWLAATRQQGLFEEVFRDAMDPGIHVHVPIVGASVEGWWVQISRRLLVVTKETPDDRHLVETLLQRPKGPALVVTEPLIIVARLTEHPVVWAMPIRVWITAGTRPTTAWRILTGPAAIHRYGLPVLSVDGESTVEETTAQLLLAAYWHGYLEGDGHEIPAALVAAFPDEVRSIERRTDARDLTDAATRLFERLLRKGFDPLVSAETMRHYVRNHARTIVRAHRSKEWTGSPWQRLDISEGYYYKLLRRRGVPKGHDGRYAVDDGLIEDLRRELDRSSESRERRQLALGLLLDRGFSREAARKWLQRHAIEEALGAWPRTSRPSDGRTKV